MTAPAPRQPEPMLLRLDRWAELRVFDDTDTGEVVLDFSRPDMPENVPGTIFDIRLSTEDVVALIDRLVGKLAEIRGIKRTEQGAGPLSSTY